MAELEVRLAEDPDVMLNAEECVRFFEHPKLGAALNLAPGVDFVFLDTLLEPSGEFIQVVRVYVSVRDMQKLAAMLDTAERSS